MLTRITYASTVTTGHGHADFLSIVKLADISNWQSKIGGVIAFDGFQFIQILESEESEVDLLFARISVDRRNDGVVDLRHQDIETRHFTNWAMRRTPLVEVLLLTTTLNDEPATSRRVDGEPLSMTVRIQLPLSPMAICTAGHFPAPVSPAPVLLQGKTA